MEPAVENVYGKPLWCTKIVMVQTCALEIFLGLQKVSMLYAVIWLENIIGSG